ncbi:MAG: glutaredoxin domain-containing protein [Solirubrobacterales bacterium]
MDVRQDEKPKITVYTTDPCARCIRAKDLLKRRGIAFEEVNLVKDPQGRRDLVELTGQMTFPQIVIDGEPLGGLQELQQADERGELAEDRTR